MCFENSFPKQFNNTHIGKLSTQELHSQLKKNTTEPMSRNPESSLARYPKHIYLKSLE